MKPPWTLAPGWLLVSFLVSTVGLALARLRQEADAPAAAARGFALLLESAFLPTLVTMLAGAGLALAALWVALRAGL